MFKTDFPMFHGWQHLTPEDRENILRGVADGKVYGGPYHLELDWVDKCNARCFFCNSEYIHNGESMAWDRAAELLRAAHSDGLRSIRLSGGGEPTLHPHLPDLLALLAEHSIALDNLNTNGTQLTAPVIAGLMRARVSEVRVSLNYCDEENYARGMGLPGKFFHRAVEMTRNLNAARQGNPNFGELQLQFFIYKPTLHQIVACYRLARELGADKIIFRELWGIEPAQLCAPEDNAVILEQMRTVLTEDLAEGRVHNQLHSHGVGEAIAAMQHELRATRPAASHGGGHGAAPADDSLKYCYIGWYSMTIVGNQSVYPCCFLLSEQTLPPLDNINGKSIREVWHGAPYARFRKEMRDYHLAQRRLPFFERRHTCISPVCATHTGCPISGGMCSDDFYREADARLEKARRAPATVAWRLANRAAGLIERKLG